MGVVSSLTYSTIDKKESKARFVEFIKIAYDGGEVDAGQILTMGNSAHTGCQLDDKCLPINSKDIWYICPTKATAGQKCTMPVEFGNYLKNAKRSENNNKKERQKARQQETRDSTTGAGGDGSSGAKPAAPEEGLPAFFANKCCCFPGCPEPRRFSGGKKKTPYSIAVRFNERTPATLGYKQALDKICQASKLPCPDIGEGSVLCYTHGNMVRKQKSADAKQRAGTLSHALQVTRGMIDYWTAEYLMEQAQGDEQDYRRSQALDMEAIGLSDFEIKAVQGASPACSALLHWKVVERILEVSFD